MGGVVIEEQAISHAQYLDLVYSHSKTLYDLIPNSPHPNTDHAKPPAEPPMHGIVGTIQSPSTVKPAKQQSSSPTTSSTHIVSTEVNAVQSLQSPSNKKKGKGTSKESSNKQENPKATAPENESKQKRKAKYPFLLCGGDRG